METMKSKSESPFSKNKGNCLPTDTPENGDTVNEQIKIKKKSLRVKQKTQLNGKENEEIKNGNDCQKEILENVHNDDENDNHEVKETFNQEENHVLNSTSEVSVSKSEETAVNEVILKTDEDLIEVGCTSKDESTTDTLKEDNEVGFKENGDSSLTKETESAKKDIIMIENSVLTEHEINKNDCFEEVKNTEVNGTPDESLKDQNHAEICPLVEEESQNGVDISGSGSHSEDLNTIKEDNIQTSADSVAKDDDSFSDKITNFLGNWNSPSQDQKQNSEVSSSKKFSDSLTHDGMVLNHPYLSKVSGRPGIRDRMNASITSLNSKDGEVKTPKNTGITLNDSFRVRTDPKKHFDHSELQQNPTLRKFKGKRCLNANDDQEDSKDIYLALAKRRKLDDKSPDSGFLGSILWSPFRKRSVESEEPLKMTTAESKLSRFLSPFWFWKKTATNQKGK